MLFDGHNAFIAFSYGITFLVFVIAILWVILDGKKQRRILAKLEQDGVTKQRTD